MQETRRADSGSRFPHRTQVPQRPGKADGLSDPLAGGLLSVVRVIEFSSRSFPLNCRPCMVASAGHQPVSVHQPVVEQSALFDVLMPWVEREPAVHSGGADSGHRHHLARTESGLSCVLMIAGAVGVTDRIGRQHHQTRPLAGCGPFCELAAVHLMVGGSTSGSMPSSHAANWFAATMVAFLFNHGVGACCCPWR